MRPLEGPARRWALGLVSLVAGGLLVWVAAAHPGLRLVDFISFSERARRLPEGVDLVHPLYPVGYPFALGVLRLVFGDILWAGKALSVAAGTGMAGVAGWWLGPFVGVWMVGQPGTMMLGTTEGTDMLAAALSLGCLAAAGHRRPVLAAVLAAMACLTRYTAVVVVPLAWVVAGQPLRFLVVFALASAPHWLLALVTGAPLLPNQAENLAIAAGATGAGQAPEFWTMHTWARWPHGFARAAQTALVDWPVRVGAVGLLVGVVRRDRRAWLLLAWACLHLGLIGFGFANVRLVLPATIAAAAGVVWLLPRRLEALILVAGLGVAGWTARVQLEPDLRETQLAAAVAAAAELEGPFLSANPWFHQRKHGWLLPSAPLRMIQADPRQLMPEAVFAFAAERGVAHVVLDAGRVRATYPGLEGLLRKQGRPPGVKQVASAPGWVVLSVPAPAEGSAPPDR